MDKYKIKIQKEKQKDIKWTLKKARVPKNATPEQVKAYLIHYVKQEKLNYWKMRFSDELLEDRDFLLSVYRANPTMSIYDKFKPSKERLQDDVDFMLEFVEICHGRLMRNHLNDQQFPYWSEQELKFILIHYDRTVSNPEFVEKFAQKFPYINIIPFIKESICKSYYLVDKDKKQKEAKDLETYKNCLAGLPLELLCEQVRKHSWRALNEIPNDIPNFNQLISVGIEIEGFRSLGRLNITQVLDNKDLIIKAYERDGIQELVKFIKHTLSPQRTHYYMCHGEPHDYTEYDKRYADVQKALMEDVQIHDIFKEEYQVAKAKKHTNTNDCIDFITKESNRLVEES